MRTQYRPVEDCAAILHTRSRVASASIARADFAASKRAYEQGDYATALKELTPLAEQGSAEAQVLLGLMQFEGQGVPRDSSQALKWYKAAAEQGNPEGQLQLGLMYLMGIALARNTPQALKLLKLSADQGTRDAQVFLGLAYRNLQDAPRDFIQAYMWFHLAALDRKSTRLNSSHDQISYAVFCLKKKKNQIHCNDKMVY